jgi:hypothetical protein
MIWLIRCVVTTVERSNAEVSASASWSNSLSFPLSDLALHAPGSNIIIMIIRGGGWNAAKAGDNEGEELQVDEEEMC